MISIKLLEGISNETLYSAFSAAFKDYEIQVNQSELFEMLQRRGFVAELSFGAFDNEDLVAFTFNGIGNHNGIRTAYDTGTGTIEAYRGKGLATRIFEYSIPYLKEADVKQYLLEVLQHNDKAISVYQKLGFNVEREFNYFVKRQDSIQLIPKKLKPDYSISSISFDQVKEHVHFCDFVPSWQNSLESIERRIDTFRFLGVFYKKDLVGYCVFEPQSGDITQIAVNKLHRRKGIGTLLLKETMTYNKHQELKCINTQLECSSVTRFLTVQNMDVSGKQFEMIRVL